MSISIESNPLIDKLPPHLKQFIKPQNYEDYTAIDHAVWRYVMRKNITSLSKFAHDSYLNGLKKTGISIDKIPSMYGMNRILKEIGWAAVAVDGFTNTLQHQILYMKLQVILLLLLILIMLNT